MAKKVKELTPITKAKEDDPNCPICHPKKGKVTEDQVWGICPTNKKHRQHSTNSRKA